MISRSLMTTTYVNGAVSPRSHSCGLQLYANVPLDAQIGWHRPHRRYGEIAHRRGGREYGAEVVGDDIPVGGSSSGGGPRCHTGLEVHPCASSASIGKGKGGVRSTHSKVDSGLHRWQAFARPPIRAEMFVPSGRGTS